LPMREVIFMGTGGSVTGEFYSREMVFLRGRGLEQLLEGLD